MARTKKLTKEQRDLKILETIFGANDPNADERWREIIEKMDNRLAERTGLSVEQIKEIRAKEGGMMQLLEKAVLRRS